MKISDISDRQFKVLWLIGILIILSFLANVWGITYLIENKTKGSFRPIVEYQKREPLDLLEDYVGFIPGPQFKSDLCRMRKRESYTPDKDGYFLSDRYLESLMHKLNSEKNHQILD